MSVNMEQVEKLKARADISYEEAKDALERCGGDLLEAMICLEKQGKAKAGGVGSYDSRRAEPRAAEHAPAYVGAGGGDGEQRHGSRDNQNRGNKGSGFSDAMREIWRFICRVIRKGNENHFEVYREGRRVLDMPVTLLVLFLLFLFYVTLPALIVALFFGCRYRFRGPDLGGENINEVMNDAADVAENLKRTVQEKAAREEKDS